VVGPVQCQALGKPCHKATFETYPTSPSALAEIWRSLTAQREFGILTACDSHCSCLHLTTSGVFRPRLVHVFGEGLRILFNVLVAKCVRQLS